MGRGKDAGIMPVLSRQAVSCWGRSSGIVAGLVQKSPTPSQAWTTDFLFSPRREESIFGILDNN